MMGSKTFVRLVSQVILVNRVVGITISSDCSDEPPGIDPIFEAIDAGNDIQVHQLLQLSTDGLKEYLKSYVDEDSERTLLHEVVAKGLVRATRAFLDMGCDIDAQEKQHQLSPLMMAVYAKNREVAQLLDQHNNDYI